MRVFHSSNRWSLSDCKSPQVLRTLLNILTDLNHAVLWMVSTRPLISKSSCPFTNPLVCLPRAPITIGITVIFMFHSFFCSLAKPRFSSFFFAFFFQFYSVVSRNSKIHYLAGSLFLFSFLFFFSCWLSLDLVVWPRLDDPFVSQNPREFCLSPFPGRTLDSACTICSYSQNIILIIITTSLIWEFFPLALAGGFPLEAEWQQISLRSFYLSLLSPLFSFILWSAEQQSPLFSMFSFFVDYFYVWLSGRD